MALSVPRPPGVSQMMKDGARVSIISRISVELGGPTVYLIDILRLFCCDEWPVGSLTWDAMHAIWPLIDDFH